MLNNIARYIIIFVICFIGNNSFAAFWNMTVGDVYIYDGYDNNQNNWQYTAEIVSASSYGNNVAYTLKRSNYENDGEDVYFYIYSTDTQIYVSENGTTGWELFFDSTLSPGSAWNVGSMRRVMHGYDSSLNAYWLEQYKTDQSGSRISPSDNYYLASGLGIVREIDYWVSANAPFIQQRRGWHPPTTESKVTEIYVATFGRAPDTAGLAYWVGQVEGGLTVDQVAQSFFDQPETKAKYPEGTSNASFISTIYQNVLNRDPDQDGWNYWVRELDRKAFSRSQAIMAIINGAKAASGSPTDAAILANKTEVGLYFVASTLGSMSDATLLLVYAQNVMNNIDSGSQSLIAAKAYIDTLASQTISPPIITLTADANSVFVNQTVFLTWTVSNATSCIATGNWNGAKDPAGGSYVINVGSVAGLRTYNLSCTGDSRTVTETVDVTVVNNGGGTGGACEQVSLGNSFVKITNSSNTMILFFFGTSVGFGADIDPNYCNLVGIQLPSTMNSFQIVAEVTQCTTDPEGGCDTLFGPTKYVPITLQKGVTQEIVIGSGFF